MGREQMGIKILIKSVAFQGLFGGVPDNVHEELFLVRIVLGWIWVYSVSEDCKVISQDVWNSMNVFIVCSIGLEKSTTEWNNLHFKVQKKEASPD